MFAAAQDVQIQRLFTIFDSHASHKHSANRLTRITWPMRFTVHQINIDIFFFLFFVSFQFAPVWMVNAYRLDWSIPIAIDSFINIETAALLTIHNGPHFVRIRIERRNWFFFHFSLKFESISGGSWLCQAHKKWNVNGSVAHCWARVLGNFKIPPKKKKSDVEIFIIVFYWWLTRAAPVSASTYKRVY